MRDISDSFFKRTVKQLELAFEGQFHYAPVYAYAKLKEQEVKNIVWIATCLEVRGVGVLSNLVGVDCGRYNAAQPVPNRIPSRAFTNPTHPPRITLFSARRVLGGGPHHPGLLPRSQGSTVGVTAWDGGSGAECI